jgi:hypothetical protein
MIVLYISTLVSSDAGDFLPMILHKSFTFRSTCFLFLAICCAYVRLILIEIKSLDKATQCITAVTVSQEYQHGRYANFWGESKATNCQYEVRRSLIDVQCAFKHGFSWPRVAFTAPSSGLVNMLLYLRIQLGAQNFFNISTTSLEWKYLTRERCLPFVLRLRIRISCDKLSREKLLQYVYDTANCEPVRLFHNRQIWICPLNKPWMPIGLWVAEASIFYAQSAHRWRWGCQSHAPARFNLQENLF